MPVVRHRQLGLVVERRTDNPDVPGSIPGAGTVFLYIALRYEYLLKKPVQPGFEPGSHGRETHALTIKPLNRMVIWRVRVIKPCNPRSGLSVSQLRGLVHQCT